MGLGERVRYQTSFADSARWDGFVFRPGDIVISTPAKCGTTWLQMICALEIFKRATFDRPLDQISPWLDVLLRPLTAVLADLGAQAHRRFIKTHTPLDGLPFDDRVTYLCASRDPRDVAVSLDSHASNTDRAVSLALREDAVGAVVLDELLAAAPMSEDAPELTAELVVDGVVPSQPVGDLARRVLGCLRRRSGPARDRTAATTPATSSTTRFTSSPSAAAAWLGDDLTANTLATSPYDARLRFDALLTFTRSSGRHEHPESD